MSTTVYQSGFNYTEQSYTTETGLQDLVIINPSHRVTVVVEGGATDDVDLEIVLDDPNSSPSRLKLSENVLAGGSPYIRTLDGPVRAVGIDIDGNNSNNIKLRVLTS